MTDQAPPPSTGSHHDFDIVVVGGGNAGCCAAMAAAETLGPGPGPRVLLIDKCPEEWAGGNTYFTAGAMRTVHAGLHDVLPLVNNVSPSAAPGITPESIDLPPYTREDFLSDMHRVTDGRYDRALGEALVDGSSETVKWMAAQGVRFQLSFNRQAYRVGGRHKFWGGLCLKTEDGGKGLVQDLRAACARLNITTWHSTAAKQLVLDPGSGAFEALVVERTDSTKTTTMEIRAKAVILAAGGFEANADMRAEHLGAGWERAHVRGTPYNTGDVLSLAVRGVSAKKAGDWSGCHSVAWDADSPPGSGDRGVSNEYTKSGYPLGITVNARGERFFDEGADLRNYTYAKVGRAILGEEGGVAFQVWDSKGVGWLRREEYRDGVVRRVWGESVEELAGRLTEWGLEIPQGMVETAREYNEAVAAFAAENPGREWDPAVRDGLSTQSEAKRLRVPKSNWALPLEEGPFMAVRVTCGITFTFGGLAIDPETSDVLSSVTDKPVPGVYCCGEMVGGLFYGNYPGGSGLTSGAVFGRKAGVHAARRVLELSGKQ